MDLSLYSLPASIKKTTNNILDNKRITQEEAVLLFKQGEPGFLGVLADTIRRKKHGNHVYFNRNFHIEPTNICVFKCDFCSYSRQFKNREEGWELDKAAMMNIVKSFDGRPVTEVHIVGGVHPKLDLEFFCDLLSSIRAHRPELHIKAFTAVELEYMFRKAKVTVKEGMSKLKNSGLDSIPGGGAEIFDEHIRKQLAYGLPNNRAQGR